MKQEITNDKTIEFQNFEYSGWQKAAACYSKFSLLTQQSVGDLLKHLHIQSGDTLLDVASGPGFLAARVQEIDAESIGIDLSEEMIKLAKRNYPKIKRILFLNLFLSLQMENFQRFIILYWIKILLKCWMIGEKRWRNFLSLSSIHTNYILLLEMMGR